MCPVDMLTQDIQCLFFACGAVLRSEQMNCALLQVIIISQTDNLDPDWMIGERGLQKGKVPIAYLEILNWLDKHPSAVKSCRACVASAVVALGQLCLFALSVLLCKSSIKHLTMESSDAFVNDNTFISDIGL